MGERVEDIVRDMRYHYFDAAIEHYLAEEVSFEEAVNDYLRRIGQLAVSGNAD